MVILFRSNDPVALSYAMTMLQDEGLHPMLFDQHASIVEGSIGAIPRRIMIPDDEEQQARRLLLEAGIEPES